MSDATAWLQTLPAEATTAREILTLEAVLDGMMMPLRWWPIRLSYGSHWGTAWVTEDALRIGTDDDAVRVTVRHSTAQRIADALDCRLLTARLSDQTWLQAAAQLRPKLQSPCSASTAAMVRHSREVDAALGGRRGLVAPAGKDWINAKALTAPKACNYGWHSTGAPYLSAATPGLRLWQTTGLAHSIDHVDYSQVVRLAHRQCIVDGEVIEIDQVLRSPALAGLVSHEGALSVVRHPGVPWTPPRVLVEPVVSDWASGCRYTSARFHGGTRPTTDLIVLHSTESPERLGTARAIASWWAGASSPKSSAHFVVDAEEVVQCVPEAQTAWHAGKTANARGIGVELVGRAAQTTADWSDDYSASELELAAVLVADLCRRWAVPGEYVDAAGLLAGARGITTHDQVRRAWHETTHTDPGRAFPMEEFLSKVRGA